MLTNEDSDVINTAGPQAPTFKNETEEKSIRKGKSGVNGRKDLGANS